MSGKELLYARFCTKKTWLNIVVLYNLYSVFQRGNQKKVVDTVTGLPAGIYENPFPLLQNFRTGLETHQASCSIDNAGFIVRV